MKHFFSLLFSIATLFLGYSTVHNVGSSGLTFTSDSVNIIQGDTVVWTLSSSHDVLEVDLATWNIPSNTPNGGFSTPFGGGMVVFNTIGDFYYVCTPHASLGMIGYIQVSAAPLHQMDLPVTFDDVTVNYSLVDFGGTLSSVIVDPTDPTNMVVQTEKTVGAQVWGGTTLAIPGGGANLDTGFV
ncbi:MAG: plastocyanin, partial [Urechidicola sp.]